MLYHTCFHFAYAHIINNYRLLSGYVFPTLQGIFIKRSNIQLAHYVMQYYITEPYGIRCNMFKTVFSVINPCYIH